MQKVFWFGGIMGALLSGACDAPTPSDGNLPSHENGGAAGSGATGPSPGGGGSDSGGTGGSDSSDGGSGGTSSGGTSSGGTSSGGTSSGGASSGGTSSGGTSGAFSVRDDCSAPTEVSVPVHGQQPSRPTVKASGDQLLLTYMNIADGMTAYSYQARWYDGTSWGAAASLGTTNDMPRPEAVAVSSGGRAVVAFGESLGEWGRHRYNPGTSSWNSAAWNESHLSLDRHLLVAAGADSFLHFWGNSNLPPSFQIISPTTVSDAEPVSDSSVGTARLLSTPLGGSDHAIVWFASVDVRAIRGRTVSSAGAVGAAEATLTEPALVGYNSYSTLISLPGGEAMLIWERRNNDLSIQLMTSILSQEGGLSFSEPVAISTRTTSNSFGNVQAVADGDGDVTVVWSDVITGETGAIRRLGGTWQPNLTVLGAATAGAAHPRIAVDAHGHVTVLYRNSAGTEISLRQVAKGAATWEPAFPVGSTGDFISTTDEPALVLDSEGNPIVIWRTGVAPIRLVMSTCR